MHLINATHVLGELTRLGGSRRGLCCAGSLPRRDLCDDALDSDAFAEAAEKLVVPRTDHGRFVALDGSASGCGGAPPPAVDSISRAGYLSCPNDNAVHDRSGHPGGYHNPGWKNAERSGGGRRCLNRLRGHPLDNTVIAIDTRTGAQTVISAEGGTHAVTVDPARHTVVASNTAAGTASVIERR